jgi:hypothetical protein
MIGTFIYCAGELLVLIVEASQHGHATLHPEARIAIRGQLNVHHEVGGVPSGGQHTAAVARLVQRTAAVVANKGQQRTVSRGWP